MKAISFSFFIFAMVFLVCSAFPGDKDKGHSSRLVDPSNSKEPEKSLQRKKPPVKPPGPQLNSENEKPQKASLFLKPAELKLLAGPNLRFIQDNPKRAPIIPTAGKLFLHTGKSVPELKLTPERTASGFLTKHDENQTKKALDCDKKKKEVFLHGDTDKKKKDKFLPVNKSKEKNPIDETRYNADLNEDTNKDINDAM